MTDVNASTAGLAWLRTELADPPEVAEVRFFRLEPGPGRSPHLLYARANVHPPSPGWVQLQTTVSSAVFADPGRQRLWLDTLFELADRLDSGYGQLGFYLEGGATALEDAFDNRVVPLERRLPAHTIGAARRALRGYSWVTIVPKELASTVDDTSSFVDVRPLSGGGLWLRATEDFRGYDEAAAGRVFAALAPVLAAGLPVRRRLVPDEAPQLLAFEDAAAHRTGSHGR